MGMFRDKDAELQRLEQALLEEEPAEPEEYLDEDALDELLEGTRPGDAPLVYQNHANDYGRKLRNYASGYRAYNADHTDTDPEELAEELQKPESAGKGFGWLVAILLLLILAGVAAWLYGGGVF